MDEEATSDGSPVVLSNPGTPLTTQVSNPGTPRNDDNFNSVPAAVTVSNAPSTTALNINVPITTVNSVTSNTIQCVSANSLLLQMVPPGGGGGGPGCIPLGSSVTQTATITNPTRSAPQSKYAQLLAVIEDLGKDIRPTYACSKSSAERLKRGIVHARILVVTTSHVLNLGTFDTEWNADCVEWCPAEGFQEILVCGTYQLFEPDKRHGCLHLFRFEEDESRTSLNHLQRVTARAAVLDIKWSRCAVDSPTVIAANALGELEMYRLKDETLNPLTTHQIGTDVLLLSLDWMTTTPNSNYEALIATSDSNGHVSVFSAHSDAEIVEINQWKAHNYEAWIVAFNKWQSSVVYSGGDDCILNGWDTRQATRIFKNTRHSMGVTSIASNPFQEHILGTGSYDENIMLWDLRQLKSPLSEFPTGGGVWRLKWDPKNGQYLLAACMHHGVCFLDLTAGLNQPTLVSHYNKHKSMAYGIDWCRIPSQVPFTTIASCSFYDHAMHIWKSVQ